jgi:hypothetical protein
MPQTLTVDHKIDRKRKRSSLLFGRTLSGDTLVKVRVFLPAGETVVKTLHLDVSRLTYLFMYVDQSASLVTNGGGNEIHRVSVTGNPDGGTIDVQYGIGGALIPWNATAGQLQAGLEPLPGFGVGNVTCYGGPLPGTPITIEFIGANANTNITIGHSITDGLTDSSMLTTPAAHLTDIVQGGPALGDSVPLKCSHPLEWFSPGHWANCPLTTDVTSLILTNSGPYSGRLLLRALMS